MRDYFIRRLLLMIPTLLGITLIGFAVTRLVPGGPIDQAQAEAQQASLQAGGLKSGGGSGGLSPEQVEQLKKFYGLDLPWPQAYATWLGVWPREVEEEGEQVRRFSGVLQGNLGTSQRYGQPVGSLLVDRLNISLYFGIITFIVTYVVCIPLGVAKAIRHRTHFDNLTSILVFIGYAIPGFVLGAILLRVFAFGEWSPLPYGGFQSEGYEDLSFPDKVVDRVRHTLLPLLAYLVGSFAFLTLLMKNSMMDQLASDYVRTAVAKGVTFKKAVLGHAFRNSLVPIATGFGQFISLVLTGSFLLEVLFDINGIGLLGYNAVVDRDFPVFLAILFFSSFLMLLGNILSDICVALVDPRIRFGKA